MLASIAFFAAVGFAAQMIDGAIGMAYGVAATTLLLAYGTAPAIASASVHTAEVFTTAASGLAHWRLDNVERRLLWRLAVPGVAGGIVGACVLTAFPGENIRPFVAVYLLAAGGIVMARGLGQHRIDHTLGPAQTVLCGLTAGFLDAAGGGGWGLLVTSTLVWGGLTPRKAIGTACLAEFFVTLAVSLTFFVTIGQQIWPLMWQVILGLVIGGIIAAPIAALAARHVPDRAMMILVGAIVMALSAREILKGLGMV